jgi:hypothetical protein
MVAAIWTTVFLAATFFVTGCSDDDEKKAMGGGNPPVLVLNEEDRTPVAGVKVMVMDPLTNTPLAGPVVTDSDGYARFSGLPVGRYPVMAFGGLRWAFLGHVPEMLQVVEPPRSKTMGQTSGGGLLAPATVDAPSLGPMRFFAESTLRDSLPRFRGVVRDAATQAPLGQAFLGQSSVPTGYRLNTDYRDDVTGPDGAFSVSGLPIAVDPQTGNLIQVQPLKIVRHGYRPVHYVHDFPNGSDETDISGLVIDLEPVGSADTGVLFGQIIRDGEPLADVPVALGFARPGEKAGPGLTGWSAVTDTSGRYRIEDLPPGIYNVLAGYLVGDGAVFGGRVPQVEVGEGTEVEVGVHGVVYEIESGVPGQGAVLSGKPEYLAWNAVPGAASYTLSLDYGPLGDATENLFTIPPETEIGPGLHVWEVGALDGDGQLVGRSQVRFLFRVEEPVE